MTVWKFGDGCRKVSPKKLLFVGILSLLIGCGESLEETEASFPGTGVIEARLEGPSVADGVPRDLVISTYKEVLDTAISVEKTASVRFGLLVDGMLFWTTASTATGWEITGGEEEVLPPLPTAPTAVVRLEEQDWLVAAGGELYVLSNNDWVLSPLSALLVGTKITAMLRSTIGPPGLWIATDEALYRWNEGVLQTLSIQGLPTAGAQLSEGWGFGGLPALWVSAGGDVYTLSLDSWNTLTARHELEEADVSRLVTDASEQVWLLSAEGLYRREVNGLWRRVFLPERVIDIAANLESDGVWLQTPSGWIHTTNGSFRTVEESPMARSLGVDHKGGLWLYDGQSVHHVVPGRPISFGGLFAGGEIALDTEIEIFIAQGGLVDQVSAWIDGNPVSLEADPWRVLLSVDELGEGNHVLSVEASFSDEFQNTTGTFPFAVVPPPTWTADVYPFYVLNCNVCHQPTAAPTVKLHSISLWIENIDKILSALNGTGVFEMPPEGPVDPEWIELIELWRDAGFPE
jgi:hypothetical protein